MNNNSIGIFDSGIGGLSVFKKIIETLPNEQYIYFADKDNVPYGLKTNEQILQYTRTAVDFLKNKNVKAIVVACNTATSIAIQTLRKENSIPIIGIEPAAKPAIENRGAKKVLVMATPVTVREKKLKELIDRIDDENSVDLIAMPELVKFAENEEFESTQVEDYLLESLKEYTLEEYSQIVLGCTHFPFFKKIIQKIFPQNTQIIDGSYGVANRLKNILQENDLLGTNNFKIDYYYSGRKVEDKKELEKFDRLLNRM